MDNFRRGNLEDHIGEVVEVFARITRLSAPNGACREATLLLQEITVNGEAVDFDHAWIRLSGTAEERLRDKTGSDARFYWASFKAEVIPYYTNAGVLSLGLENPFDFSISIGGKWVRVAKNAAPRLSQAEAKTQKRLVAEALARRRWRGQEELMLAYGEMFGLTKAAQPVMKKFFVDEQPLSEGEERVVRKAMEPFETEYQNAAD